MKISGKILLLMIVGFVGNSSSLPVKNRMVYLQRQPHWYGAPQRMMYVQYVQPSSRTHARSTQAAAALVAGDSLATGSYLKETDVTVSGPAIVDLVTEKQQQEQQQHGEDALGAVAAQSVAESYPGEEDVQLDAADAPAIEDADNDTLEGSIENDVETEADNINTKVPRVNSFEASEGDSNVTTSDAEASDEAPAVNFDVSTPESVTSVAVVKPARRYLPPNRKVYVELEESENSDDANAAEEEEDADESIVDEEEDQDFAVPVAPVNPVRVPNAHRPTKKTGLKPVKPVKAAQTSGSAKPSRAEKPLPVGTFFPTDFGGATGGAIAIANSFSTGEGGSATSHAVAYGAPEPSRARFRAKLH